MPPRNDRRYRDAAASPRCAAIPHRGARGAERQPNSVETAFTSTSDHCPSGTRPVGTAHELQICDGGPSIFMA